MLALNELRGVGNRDWLGLREFSSEPLPDAVARRSSSTSRTAWSTATASRSSTSSRSASPATSTSSPATLGGWSAPTATTSASTWTATTRSGGSTSRRSSGSRSTPGSTASSSTRPSCRWGRSSTAPASARTACRGFRSYLRELPEDRLDPALSGVDLDTFHYGDWLLARGFDFKDDRESDAAVRATTTGFQCRAIERHFGELAGYTREYAAQHGSRGAGLGQLLQPATRTYLALADTSIS